MSLKSKAIRAVLWSGTDLLLRQGIAFAFAVTLARLLSPEEFGTIGLLAIFVGLATTFVDCGFSSALIQRQDVTYADECTVFWFNLFMGALVACLLGLTAPTIAAFYDLPALTHVVYALSLKDRKSVV